MFSRLRALMRQWNGLEVFTSTAADVPAWLLSLTLHILMLVVISLLHYTVPNPFSLTLSMPEPTVLEEMPQEFHFQNEISDKIGALSDNGLNTAMAAAPILADLAEVKSDPNVDPLEFGDIEISEPTEFVTTPLDTSTKLVRGVAGAGVTGASGAIDRITHEILLSLDDRDTLVVWLFDQSGSLTRQRTEINARLQRIYEELGLIHSDIGNPTSNRNPLLTSIMAFGKSQHG